MGSVDSTPPISVVIFQRDKWWIAQCLQYDIGAQAFTVEDVVYELQRSLIGHISICEHHKKRPFIDLPSAPAAYWKKFKGTTLRIESVDAPFRIPAAGLPKAEIRIAG